MARKPARRKISIALGIGADRKTLIADIENDKAKLESERRAAEAEARTKYNFEQAQKADKWGQEQNRLKDLAETYQDGGLTLEGWQAETKAARAKFPDFTAAIEALERAAIRNKDTVQFNNYTAGAMDIEEFLAYSAGRKKDGGDLSHLAGLVARAKSNEDKVQYSNLLNGALPFEAWQTYAAKRQAEDPNNTILKGYMASAQVNENKIQDSLKRTLYESGQIDEREYTTYLQTRLDGANSPTDAANLRSAVAIVKKNEFNKGVNEILDDYSSERIDGGTALVQLHGKMGETNDASLQAAVQKHIGTIKAREVAASKAGAASMNQALKDMQNQLDEIHTGAVQEHQRDRAAARAAVASGGAAAFNGAVSQLIRADAKFIKTLGHLASRAPDKDKKADWIADFERQQSGHEEEIYNLAQDVVASIFKPKPGEKKSVNPVRDATAFLIGTAARNPRISDETEARLVTQGLGLAKKSQEEFYNSAEGQKWHSIIYRVGQSFKQNTKAYENLVAHYEKMGVRLPSQENLPLAFIANEMEKPGGAERFRSFLEAGGAKGFANTAESIQPKFVKDGKTFETGIPTTVTDKGVTAAEWEDTITKLLPFVLDANASIREIDVLNPNSAYSTYSWHKFIETTTERDPKDDPAARPQESIAPEDLDRGRQRVNPGMFGEDDDPFMQHSRVIASKNAAAMQGLGQTFVPAVQNPTPDRDDPLRDPGTDPVDYPILPAGIQGFFNNVGRWWQEEWSLEGRMQRQMALEKANADIEARRQMDVPPIQETSKGPGWNSLRDPRESVRYVPSYGPIPIEYVDMLSPDDMQLTIPGFDMPSSIPSIGLDDTLRVPEIPSGPTVLDPKDFAPPAEPGVDTTNPATGGNEQITANDF